MRRTRRSVAGNILLINLASVPLPDVHLHLDQAMGTFLWFDVESSCLSLRGEWIQVSVLHPAAVSAVAANELRGRELEVPILELQGLFDAIIVFCCPNEIGREVHALAAVAFQLRKPIIFVSNDESAMTNIALALRTAAAQIIEGVTVVGISAVVNGKEGPVKQT